MALPRYELLSILLRTFPGAEIDLEDMTGDQNHYELRIKSAKFNGLTRVAQHQMVYQALTGHFSDDLHALVLKTEPTAAVAAVATAV